MTSSIRPFESPLATSLKIPPTSSSQTDPEVLDHDMNTESHLHELSDESDLNGSQIAQDIPVNRSTDSESRVRRRSRSPRMNVVGTFRARTPPGSLETRYHAFGRAIRLDKEAMEIDSDLFPQSFPTGPRYLSNREFRARRGDFYRPDRRDTRERDAREPFYYKRTYKFSREEWFERVKQVAHALTIESAPEDFPNIAKRIDFSPLTE